MSSISDHLRQIPSVDEILRSDDLRDAVVEFGRRQVLAAARLSAEEVRQEILDQGSVVFANNPADDMVAGGAGKLEVLTMPSLARVFNLTGTVIHTNLGRAPLPDEAIEAMSAAARFPSSLEFDLESGRRGDRDEHLEGLICGLTGAEAATVVNNNAAAVMLALNTLALRKHVLVSRGQLIEIGGSFRMPDIMKRAGAKLCEVGTTNRTHLSDFSSTVVPSVSLIMEVHISNYQVTGFTRSVATSDLADLARSNGLPLLVDLGSGTLVDLAHYGLPHEPTVAEVVRDGADLVTFSGDKLLGGPQAGIIVGRTDLIARIKRNPMKRAMRIDKISIAALRAVLQLYSDPDQLSSKLPILRMLNRPVEDIEAQAHRVLPQFAQCLAGFGTARVVACKSQIGSGALPATEIASAGIAVEADKTRQGGASARKLSAAFRQLPVPVIGRLSGNRLVLDLRSLDDEATLIGQLDHLDVTDGDTGL